MFKKWLRNIMKVFNSASPQTDFAILICDFTIYTFYGSSK